MTVIVLPWPPSVLSPNDRQCVIDGCGKPISYKNKGLCKMHYSRFRRHGDPLKTLKTPNGDPIKFLLSVASAYEGEDCLNWPYGKTGDGYPRIRKYGRAHILLCEHAHGPKPTDGNHEVAHGCGNRLCVNPRHLRWATPEENQADRVIHGTSNRGERQWSSILTQDDVLKIRSLEGEMSLGELAKMFGVGRQAIHKIHRRQRWCWL